MENMEMKNEATKYGMNRTFKYLLKWNDGDLSQNVKF